jgi:hypothetical protein
MVSVALSWDRQTPANKVGLSKVIRANTDMGLAEAKRCVDRCLKGETVVIMVDSDAVGERLISQARSLGWSAQIVENDPIDPDGSR